MTDELQRGRQGFARQAWREAYESLSRAGRPRPLGADDLELLATSAYMLGHQAAYFDALERAHEAHLGAGEPLRAARSAFWIGANLALQGEAGRASGWLGRAQRLVDAADRDCVERGYLLIPVAFRHEATGDTESAARVAGDAAKVAERFGDRDLFALAVHQQGHLLIRQGRADEGLPLLDEAMVAATGGELSPIATGIVYCGVILACQDAHELGRAREWTEALTEWCEHQPELVAFTGRCRLHRAEIMQLRGAWIDALDEARRAEERSAAASNRSAVGEATYLRAEVHRLRGELAAAEEGFREASRCGREPQPGLALLRLSQGRDDAAGAAIRRALNEIDDPAARARLLPAAVEIMIAAGDVGGARDAARELEEIAGRLGSSMLEATAATSRGAVDVAGGDPGSALMTLRRGWQLLDQLEAPYEAARARVWVGLACRALGDGDAAELELDAARQTFAALGAKPELARIEALTATRSPAEAHGLTERELEVLRKIAAGKTNREIGAELVISEHTVARHAQNIFAKLRVSSRTAASAYAFEHDLV